MKDYVIVTDATAELAPELAREYGIFVLPMPVDIDGSPYVPPDGGQDPLCRDFFTRLRQGGVAHTSQINQAVYDESFTKWLRQDLDVLYLCLSSGLSGTYLTACHAAEGLAYLFPGRRVVCVDTLCAAYGQALIATLAAQKKREGLSLDALAEWVKEYRSYVCHRFTVEDMGYLYRGGRMALGAAVACSMLQVRPILEVDNAGKLAKNSMAKGRRRAFETMVDRMKATWRPDLSPLVFTGHADNEADHAVLSALLAERLPQAQQIAHPIDPYIGAHLGPGAICLVYMANSRE